MCSSARNDRQPVPIRAAAARPDMSRQRLLTDPAALLIAERLRVLGQPLRIKLIGRLAIRDTTVQGLVDALGTTQQNISQHLGVLRRAGIVVRHKEGRRAHYQLADSGIIPILERTEASLSNRLTLEEHQQRDPCAASLRASVLRRGHRLAGGDACGCRASVRRRDHRGRARRGAAALLRKSAHARDVAVATTLFAIAGFVLGLSFTVRAGGAIDIAYHAVMLPLLLLTLIVCCGAEASCHDPAVKTSACLCFVRSATRYRCVTWEIRLEARSRRDPFPVQGCA
jgi:DNA-binding transcriptional ArsR family regulator